MRTRRTGGPQHTSTDEPEQWNHLSTLQSHPQILFYPPRATPK